MTCAEGEIYYSAAPPTRWRRAFLIPRKYQNTDHQPYLSLLRPPQARTAHFKRLYRK
jgi:hypothetical protein